MELFLPHEPWRMRIQIVVFYIKHKLDLDLPLHVVDQTGRRSLNWIQCLLNSGKMQHGACFGEVIIFYTVCFAAIKKICAPKRQFSLTLVFVVLVFGQASPILLLLEWTAWPEVRRWNNIFREFPSGDHFVNVLPVITFHASINNLTCRRMSTLSTFQGCHDNCISWFTGRLMHAPHSPTREAL